MTRDRQEVIALVEACLASDLTPREACASRPDLVDEVSRAYGAARRVQAELDEMFPPSRQGDDLSAPLRSGARALPGDGFPSIPGYAIEALLGHGGMGVVYRARHLALNRPVAIKMLLAGACASPAELARFLREAEAIAALRHPNVVHVYDLGDLRGRPFFTMELMGGGHLGQKLHGTPLPAREAAALLETLASAVDVAHRAGIVHRDLKPSNILLSDDGTPKIADFGLARRVEGDDLLTCSGARVGTPSYMAPEQVAGHVGAAGPAADVYALGAVLYEMLTGRPPFRGESVRETERQLLANDPVSPSRLNTRVPRDLETICLACLRKDPARRYAGAADLAADLRRYRADEPIRARATGRAERAAKWVRRHPTFATALAGTLVISAFLIGGLSWLAAQRAATDRAAQADLADAVSFQRAGAWREAGAALDRATLRLGSGGGPTLCPTLAQARDDQARVGRLEKLRMLHAEGVGRRLKFVESDEGYAAEFLAARLGGESDAAQAVAGKVRASNIRVALVDALDDWAQCSPGEQRGAWIAAVARAADVDPTGWRDRLRDPKVWKDGPALSRAVADAPLAGQPAPFLLAVAFALRAGGQDTVPYLTRVQQAHPGDYWANFALGHALGVSDPASSLRYFQAAIALRPEVAVSHNSLGTELQRLKRSEEAVREFGRALACAPDSWQIRGNYANSLFATGRHAESLSTLDATIAANPSIPELRRQRADILLMLQRSPEAIDGYWDAVDVDPAFVDGWRSLWSIEARTGAWDELRTRWQACIARHPDSHPACGGYAELLLFLGREDDYRLERTRLLARFRGAADPYVCERVGRACLLLPGTPDEVSLAAALVDRALASDDPRLPHDRSFFLFAKALADYRRGRYEAALATLDDIANKVLVPAPWLLIAACHERLGRHDYARLYLANSAVDYDWFARSAEDSDAWLRHALRRDVEATVKPDLPALLAGRRPPADNKERFAMLPAAEYAEREAFCARLWGESVARNPRIAVEHAFAAASACALAGCRRGSDASTADDADRAAFRANALEWLSAELDRQLKSISKGGDDAGQARNTLRRWRSAYALRYVRDDDGLAALPEQERGDWQAFWTKVSAAADERK